MAQIKISTISIIYKHIKHILEEGELDENSVVRNFRTTANDNKSYNVKYYNLDTKKAKETILKMDKKRASYYNFYSDKKWGRAESYNLTIDSSVGIDAACEIIKFYVEKKLNIKL